MTEVEKADCRGGMHALKSRTIAVLLISVLVSWFIPAMAHSDAPEGMEFKRGEGLEEIRKQEERLVAELLAKREKARQEEYKNGLIAKAQKLKGTKQGQCVVAVRAFLWGNANLGREQIQGSAKNLKINSKEPAVGAIMLIDTKSKHEHVGVVLDYDSEKVTYYDSNGDLRGTASIRTIATKSKKILGYRIIKS